ncbi:hypothetical protein L13192_10123 [Pyrenophora tritici-repentis]|nr:hypothetical protein L13192_10123 [Pyrenophora tritici-repentis]
MPPKKRGLSDAAPQNKRPKVASRGTVSQPIVLDTQQSLLRLSPRKALVKAAQTADFESQLRESQAVTAPTRRSNLGLQPGVLTSESPGNHDQRKRNLAPKT